jgi:hypothetical protein
VAIGVLEAKRHDRHVGRREREHGPEAVEVAEKSVFSGIRSTVARLEKTAIVNHGVR